MSKFIKVKTEGNKNIIGDNNTQDNSKKMIVNHFHNNTDHGGGTDGTAAIGIVILAGIALWMLIWKFYYYIDVVFNYLTIGLLTSPFLIILAVSILYLKNQLEYADLRQFIYSTIITALLYYFLNYTYNHISIDMVKLAINSDSSEFLEGLSEDGKKVAYSNFLTALLIGISSFFNHLISLRKLSYSLSNIYAKGFWYEFYSFLKFINFKFTFVFIGFLIIVIGLNFKGMIFGI